MKALALSGSISASILYENVPILESCLCSCYSSRSWSSISNALSRLKNFWSKRAPNGISLLLSYTCSIGHYVLNSLIFLMAASIYSFEHKSILFSKTLSEKHTCSTASFSTPSGFSSSILGIMCLASTTVIIPSNLYRSVTRSSTKNV